MRRTEFLITEVRNSTDNTDTNGVKDAEILGYFNYGQKLIQNIIVKVNPKADIFKQQTEYTYDSSGEYDLPTDIFAQNSLSAVEYRNGDDYFPIDRIDPTEFGRSGYHTIDKVLKIVGFANFDIRITAFRALPKMDKRWGKVSVVTSGVSLVLTGNDDNASTVDDYISVVDKFGAQIRGEIFIDTYSGATWSTTDALTGVTTSHYVCMGKNSVNASLLPDECEPFLLDYVRQRVYTRNNYNDGEKQVYFTESHKADISALFANNQKDVLIPPITDYDSINF